MSTYMKKHRQQTTKLRVGITLAAFLGLGLLYSPTIMLAHDAYAQPAPTTQPATKVVTTGAVTPVTQPATETKTETKVETKTEGTAPASTEKEQSWWQALLVPILGVIGMFIATFLTAGLLKLVKLIEKKWNVDIPDSFERLMVEKAKWALGWAEEKAETKLLYEGGAKTEGAKKISDVVTMLHDFAEKSGYGEEWTREKVQSLAEGVLHLERGVTIGSTGERALKIEAAKNGG